MGGSLKESSEAFAAYRVPLRVAVQRSSGCQTVASYCAPCSCAEPNPLNLLVSPDGIEPSTP